MFDTMPNDNTPREPMITTDEYFGGCPTCGKNDGYRNVGRSHWFFCLEHRVVWCAGSNLFSSWHGETEAEQREKHKLIEDFEQVEPIYPSRNTLNITAAERDAFERYVAENREKLVRAIDEYREKLSRAIADWKPAITADTVSEAVDDHYFVVEEDSKSYLEGDAAARDALLQRVATDFCRNGVRGIWNGIQRPIACSELDDDLPF
jgi:hypothetical protein